ncbi:Hint domain-containing protein [Psychrobacter sp. Ps6]|uniref:Hint domain-containing protein n=1 Tax=Psychrobacter sp. Ps6 TaxID=2790960 RepID=UPI001EDF06F0|nr:Hint domain-containing protein [Psychrobacter sp. Ps6]MCG3878374.1 Hint domain-containing protein [Psychrobacter sp. Ps6]
MDKEFSGFTAGTLVHTEKGLVPIEQLKIGDKVLSKLADGSGELIYKSVKNTRVTESVLVKLLELSIAIDSSLPMQEQIELQRLVDDQPSTRLLITENHPLWIESSKWTQAKKVRSQDVLINKDLIKYSAESGNNPYDTTSLRKIYRTDRSNIGFVPNFDEDSPAQYGSLIDLTTGEEIKYGVTYQAVTDKLYEYDKEWKQRLLEQTPKDEREHAEFFGFRQGEWKDPDTIDWEEGEGSLTMTVYNIEVEDTHLLCR